jgi:hypothetical protein
LPDDFIHQPLLLTSKGREFRSFEILFTLDKKESFGHMTLTKGEGRVELGAAHEASARGRIHELVR